MRLTRLLGGFAKLLVGVGVVLLLFTAYQIWGTALSESHSQSQLRAHLQKELPPKVRQDPPTVSPGPPALAGATATPSEGQPVGVLDIPSIGLNQVVVEGVGDGDLEEGPGHYPGTPLPGQAGNVAVAGHRTTWGHPFYNLDAVKPGDQVNLTTPQGSFTYRSQRVFIVSPDDSSVLAPTPVPSLTLTTCNPRYSAAQRLVLRAVLTSSRLSGLTVAAHHKPPVSHTHGAQLAGTTTGSWGVVAAWGAAVLAAGTLVWWLAQRRRRRWPLYVAGTPAVLVLLYFFFASITPMLPATF
jgi:sortase A